MNAVPIFGQGKPSFQVKHGVVRLSIKPVSGAVFVRDMYPYIWSFIPFINVDVLYGSHRRIYSLRFPIKIMTKISNCYNLFFKVRCPKVYFVLQCCQNMELNSSPVALDPLAHDRRMHRDHAQFFNRLRSTDFPVS